LISVHAALAVAVLLSAASAVLVGVVLAYLRREPTSSRAEDATAPFVGLRSFFSPSERDFVLVLTRCLGPQFRVFGKVRLADMVTPDQNLADDVRRRVRGRSERRRVGIVVCQASDLTVCGAIELEDLEDPRRQRYIRSGFVEDVLASADIPLLRIDAQDEYDEEELREEVFRGLALGEYADDSTKLPGDAHEAGVPVSAAPLCPQCGVAMARCRSSVGDQDSHEFWGCRNFPECSYVVPLSETA